jgi:hypothetical protein
MCRFGAWIFNALAGKPVTGFPNSKVVKTFAAPNDHNYPSSRGDDGGTR